MKRKDKKILKDVEAQYSRWIFPKPISDLNAPEDGVTIDGFAPRNLFYAYWPAQAYREDLDILVAGCGANAAARYAFYHPNAQVVGIDISEASLDHERSLQKKHNLKNLLLERCSIEEVDSLKKSFDFIDATGVLHHLPNPSIGLSALRNVLRIDGVVGIMLYGKYGRVGVYMLQEFFRILGLEQTENDVARMKESLHALKSDHFAQLILKYSKDATFDAGLVDLFLHKSDTPFNVSDCLELLEDAEMKFQGWVENFYYYPDGQIDTRNPIFSSIAALDEREQWKAMELFFGTLPRHAFFACRNDRDEHSYRISFEENDFLNYIPISRANKTTSSDRFGKKNLWIQKIPFPAIPLNEAEGKILSFVDGKKTIAQCLQLSNIGLGKEESITMSRNLFSKLWRSGLLFFRK